MAKKKDIFDDLELPSDAEIRRETHIEKIRVSNKGKKRSLETRKNVSKGIKGKTRPEHVKQKIKNTLIGRIHKPESIEKMKDSKLKMTDETKQKIRQARLGTKRPRGICPHCKKELAISVLTRHHYDKCKHKAQDIFDDLQLPSDEEIKRETRGRKTSDKLTGRKKPEHQKKMKENNPMKGKVSPNRGKSMPQISEKVKGKKKPEGFGEKISKARKELNLSNAWAGKERPDQSNIMKDPSRNKGAEYMREVLTCPHCGKTANGPNYKRWHGDNCKHK